MTAKLSKELSKLTHQIGGEREDRIITGKTKLTVTQIFLMDENWKDSECLLEIRSITRLASRRQTDLL